MLAILIGVLWYIYHVYAPPLSLAPASTLIIGLTFVMIPDVLSTSLLCLAVWVVWKAIEKFKLMFVSDLDNISGPPTDSYLEGKHCLDLWYVV